MAHLIWSLVLSYVGLVIFLLLLFHDAKQNHRVRIILSLVMSVATFGEFSSNLTRIVLKTWGI